MNYKEGDRYEMEYIGIDDDGEEFDKWYLYGNVVYADKQTFIIEASPASNYEITGWRSITFEKCRENYPLFDYENDSEEIKFKKFIPLDQETEQFLIDDGEFI